MVVVIAILAAITIVAYTGIQERARTAVMANSLSQANKKLLAYSVEAGQFPADKSSFLTVAGITESPNLAYSYQVTADAKNYCVSANDPTRSVEASRASVSTGGSDIPGVCIRNISKNGRGISGSGEYGGRYGTSFSWVTAASDGPVGITSYARQTFTTTATAATGRGFDFNVNLDVTPPVSNTNWPVTSGQAVSVSVYLRSSIANASTILRCRTYSNGAWVGSQTQSATVNAAANQWNRLSLNHTSTANGYLACTARPDASTTWTVGSTIDATGLLVTEGSTLYNFADGASPTWVWDGAASASQSIGPAVTN